MSDYESNNYIRLENAYRLMQKYFEQIKGVILSIGKFV